MTTVDLWPHTGRKRQLRRHLALVGHPLVGEPRYSWGYAQQRLLSGQAMDPQDHRRLPDAPAGAAVGGSAAATAAASEDAQPVPPPEPSAAYPLLRAAAAAASQRHALLLHLWAVELRLRHPATGEPLHVVLDEPPLFATTRAALSGGLEA